MLIAAMHGSGTSSLARTMSLLGCALPRTQTASDANRERADWGACAVTKLSNEILESAGLSCDSCEPFSRGWYRSPLAADFRERALEVLTSEFGASRLFVLKDPRICRLMPFWLEVLEAFGATPHIVCLIRNPLEIAVLLEKRSGFDPALSNLLWLRHVLDAEASSRDCRRAFVRYENLLERQSIGDQLGEALGISWPRRTSALGVEVEQIPTPDVRRQISDVSVSRNAGSSHWIRSSFEILDSWARGDVGDGDTAELDRIKAAFDEATLVFGRPLAASRKAVDERVRLISELARRESDVQELSDKLKRQSQRAKSFQTSLCERERQLEALLASTSWRATAPLRGISCALRYFRLLLPGWMVALRQRRAVHGGRSGGKFGAIGQASARQRAQHHQAPEPDASPNPPRSARPDAHTSAKSGSGLQLSERDATELSAVAMAHRSDSMARAVEIGQASSAARSLCLGVVPKKLEKTTFGKTLRAIGEQASSVELSSIMSRTEEFLEGAFHCLEQFKDRPLVSVIMATHNRACVIGDAVSSVFQQDYPNWELLICDDGSSDNTEAVISAQNDGRLRYFRLERKGAAAARNFGLQEASGAIVAYLDSDNIWHPSYLSAVVSALSENSGQSAAYTDYIDYELHKSGTIRIRAFGAPAFNHEQLLNKNYIDLNTFSHRRELHDVFGGFNEALIRRQDYDLILKYTWLRDPVHVPIVGALYQRNKELMQITSIHKDDMSCVPIIKGAVERYFSSGLPLPLDGARLKITILAWDMCRNHFSKPFALAEALSAYYNVQLVAFRFFAEEIFFPLKGVHGDFETVYLPGCEFPDFFAAMERAVESITGDVLYVVKPRLPSLGVALLANARRGTPIILEINDLETVINSPKHSNKHIEASLEHANLLDPRLLSPHSVLWSQILDPLSKQLPVLVTHNKNIDRHYGNQCLYMRNIKDEETYNPDRYDRDRIRNELGYSPDDRILLFGGMVRKHKGVFELVRLVQRLNDQRYKLLFVGSRVTPDQERLSQEYGEEIRLLPPQDREQMAKINFAADLVVLWLDPDVPASHYQMPYKVTDALAMKTPIIANDISDIGDLGRQGYLKLVPFGDWDGMDRAIRELFDDLQSTVAACEAGRRLYLRQFSYAAARGNFALMLKRLEAAEASPLGISVRFAEWFEAFRLGVTGSSDRKGGNARSN